MLYVILGFIAIALVIVLGYLLVRILIYQIREDRDWRVIVPIAFLLCMVVLFLIKCYVDNR